MSEMAEVRLGQTPSGDGLEELVDLGPEMFSDVSGTVINYQGENYYKACGEFVADNSDGGSSSCVLPARFPHEVHSNYRGDTTEGTSGVLVSLTAQPRDHKELDRVLEQVCGITSRLNKRGIRFSFSVYAMDGDDS